MGTEAPNLDIVGDCAQIYRDIWKCVSLMVLKMMPSSIRVSRARL